MSKLKIQREDHGNKGAFFIEEDGKLDCGNDLSRAKARERS